MKEFPFWILHLALLLTGFGLFAAVFLSCAPPIPPKEEDARGAEGSASGADSSENGSGADRERLAFEVLFRWERAGGESGHLSLLKTRELRGDFALPRKKSDLSPYDGFWFWEVQDAGGECLFREEFLHPGLLFSDEPDEEGDLHGGPVLLDSADFTLLVPARARDGKPAAFLAVFAKENGNIGEMGRWPLRPDKGGRQ